MIGSLLICMVFLRAAKGGYLTSSAVLPVTVGAIAIAVLRSVFMPKYGDEPARFTAFSSAQSFAAFIAALYCIALCSKGLRSSVRIPLCALLAATLFLDGSRIWAIGIALVTLFALLISDARFWVKICGVGIAVAIAAVLAASADQVMAFLAQHAESNRIAAAVSAVYEGDVKSYGLGTYKFRRGLDAKEIGAITDSSPTQLLFGHGTSNGALVITGSLFKADLDPNRLMHNEWLRVIYEWGLIGLILWLMFLGSLTIFAARGVQIDKNGNAKPLLVYIPAFLLGLAGENIIAGAGNAVSVGFLLLIALASISHRQPRPFFRERGVVRISLEPAVSAGER
ncbi:MAG: O-antigen ligase family protein, partial [Acidobacteriaceae bacterium]|nr:O-antigen ligase family protein [Acidobacteriaceae bacterium]